MVALLQAGALGFEGADLVLQGVDLELDLAAELLGLGGHGVALPGGLFHVAALLIFQAAVLLANLGAAVLALDTAQAELLGAVAAQLVVTHAVVDVQERHVHANVALVGAPEARQGIGGFGGAGDGARQRLFGRESVEVGAGGGARFVGAVGAVAAVVVDLAQAELDCRVGDAGEVIFALVMGGDCAWEAVLAGESGVNSFRELTGRADTSWQAARSGQSEGVDGAQQRPGRRMLHFRDCSQAALALALVQRWSLAGNRR